MVAHVQTVYRYKVDQTDRIVDVDHWWVAFAKENSASQLNQQSVLGRSLWQFISDEPTRSLYKEIHSKVRSTGKPISVPFRCDSPTLQRHMRLTIRSHGDGLLSYESILIRTVSQSRQPVLDPSQKRSEAFLTMCSFCKRSLIEPSGWLEMEDIALKLRMYKTQLVPGLRYTVCPQCEKL